MAKEAGPHIIPEDHIALVGRIIDAWAHLEFHIDRGIWHLANTQQQLAACITSQFMSIHPRMNAFIALASIRNASEESVAALKSFYGTISGLNTKRNRLVHDSRHRDKTTGAVGRFEFTAKPNVQFGFVPESKEELEETLRQVDAKIFEFIELRNSVLAELDVLPQESQPTLSRIVDLPPSPSDPPNDVQES